MIAAILILKSNSFYNNFVCDEILFGFNIKNILSTSVVILNRYIQRNPLPHLCYNLNKLMIFKCKVVLKYEFKINRTDYIHRFICIFTLHKISKEMEKKTHITNKHFINNVYSFQICRAIKTST